MLDVEALAGMMAGLIGEHVEQAVGPLIERIATLEDRQPERGEKGEEGAPGADGTTPDPGAIAAAFVPTAQTLIADEVARAVAALPPPPAGEKGEKGDPGEPGADGQHGRDGADGRGIRDLLIDRDGNLVATLSDGEMKALGRVAGADGKDGRDGADGQDAASDDGWAQGLSGEEKAAMIGAMLRKEIGEADLISLPDPIATLQSAQQAQPAVVVHNHLPKRGTEKTVVTKHDERGRILEFERREA